MGNCSIPISDADMLAIARWVCLTYPNSFIIAAIGELEHGQLLNPPRPMLKVCCDAAVLLLLWLQVDPLLSLST